MFSFVINRKIEFYFSSNFIGIYIIVFVETFFFIELCYNSKIIN